jgi:hypothetical protein
LALKVAALVTDSSKHRHVGAPAGATRQEAGMISTSADIDRYIREQPIRDANTAAQAK